jgi:DnaJ-class molecular chaperone
MIDKWYAVIYTFLGALVTAICTGLWYRVDGNNEAFYTWIGSSIIALLAGIGIGVSWFFGDNGGNAGQSSENTWRRREGRMNCRYCNGSGSTVTKVPGLTTHDTCVVCGGHGNFVTPLSSQPDCRRCNGSGGLVTRYAAMSIRTPCDVCNGIGKRPLGT